MVEATKRTYRSTNQYKGTSLRLPVDTFEKVKKWAREDNISLLRFWRRMVDEYVSRRESASETSEDNMCGGQNDTSKNIDTLPLEVENVISNIISQTHESRTDFIKRVVLAQAERDRIVLAIGINPATGDYIRMVETPPA